MPKAFAPGTSLKRLLYLLGGDAMPPSRLDHVHASAISLGDILHSATENAIDAHDHLVAGLDQIANTCLHAGTTRAGDGHGHLVIRLKNLPQHLSRLIHDVQVLGIQMTDRGRSQRLQHAGGNIAGPRAP